MGAQEPAITTWMSELSDGEQLVIWSFRRWVAGGTGWPLVRREFVARFGGESGRAALCAFVRLIDALRAGARRPITYHQACCPCVGGDELVLAALVTVPPGQDPRARALAADLVHDAAALDLLAQAAEFAGILRRRGVVLGTTVRAAGHSLH